MIDMTTDDNKKHTFICNVYKDGESSLIKYADGRFKKGFELTPELLEEFEQEMQYQFLTNRLDFINMKKRELSLLRLKVSLISIASLVGLFIFEYNISNNVPAVMGSFVLFLLFYLKFHSIAREDINTIKEQLTKVDIMDYYMKNQKEFIETYYDLDVDGMVQERFMDLNRIDSFKSVKQLEKYLYDYTN